MDSGEAVHGDNVVTGWIMPAKFNPNQLIRLQSQSHLRIHLQPSKLHNRPKPLNLHDIKQPQTINIINRLSYKINR